MGSFDLEEEPVEGAEFLHGTGEDEARRQIVKDLHKQRLQRFLSHFPWLANTYSHVWQLVVHTLQPHMENILCYLGSRHGRLCLFLLQAMPVATADATEQHNNSTDSGEIVCGDVAASGSNENDVGD